jgi:hypothetical protein
VTALVSSALLALGDAPAALQAAVVAAVPAFGARAGLRLLVDRGRPWPVVGGRVLAALVGLAAGAALVPVALAVVPRSAALVAAPLVMTAVLLSAGLRARAGTTLGAVGPPAMAMGLSAMAGLLLLPAGLLVAGPGRALGVAELSGESRRETVRWSPGGLPAREEGLRAHRVLVRNGQGTALGEGFVFGSAATLHGIAYGRAAVRILELANDAGAEGRHYPPRRVPLLALGPAAVPGYWREVQGRVLEAAGLPRRAWASGLLPLVDGQGLPLRATHRLESD